MKRLLRSIAIAIGFMLIPLTVLAAVSDISSMTGNPTSATIILTWIKPIDANTTVIRYRTDTYPTSPSDGTLAYNSTSFQTTVSGLTSGQAYYFAAWGQNGATYSTNSYNLTMSTLAVTLPTGAISQGNNVVPVLTDPIPSAMNQQPNNAGFQLEPFTSIIGYFNGAPGGLGMPINNAWESMAILGIVGSGAFTYTKIRNFFVAYLVVFVVTVFAVNLTLVQGWLLGIEIVIGLGVWAVDHYLQ